MKDIVGAPLGSIVSTLSAGSSSEQRVQARIAAAVALDPRLQGKRDLAVASGLHERTVQRWAPWTRGEVTGLLHCDQHGTQGVDVDEPRLTKWSITTTAQRCPSRSLSTNPYLGSTKITPPSSTSTRPDKMILTSRGSSTCQPDEAERSPGQACKSEGEDATGAPLSGEDMQVLDPSLDVWSEPQGRRDDLACVGTDGWALAALALAGHLGELPDDDFLDVPLSVVRELLCVSEATARRLAERMERAGLAVRGRGVLRLMGQILEPSLVAGRDRAQDRERRVAREVRDFRDPRLKFERRGFLAWAAEHDPARGRRQLHEWFERMQAARKANADQMAALLAECWADEAPREVVPAPAQAVVASGGGDEVDTELERMIQRVVDGPTYPQLVIRHPLDREEFDSRVRIVR